MGAWDLGARTPTPLVELAAVGKHTGLRTVGVIRGEERPYNSVLADCVRDGMELHYLDRVTYRLKSTATVQARLRQQWGDFFLVPEGGTTAQPSGGAPRPWRR